MRSQFLRGGDLFALSCALAFALFCAHVHSFVSFCVFLRPTVFRTTAFENFRSSCSPQEPPHSDLHPLNCTSQIALLRAILSTNVFRSGSSPELCVQSACVRIGQAWDLRRDPFGTPTDVQCMSAFPILRRPSIAAVTKEAGRAFPEPTISERTTLGVSGEGSIDMLHFWTASRPHVKHVLILIAAFAGAVSICHQNKKACCQLASATSCDAPNYHPRGNDYK